MTDEQLRTAQVSGAIIAQLGGPKIFAMAFDSAYTLVGPRGVTLRVAKSLSRKRGIVTHIKIDYCEGTDTYAIEYIRSGGAREGWEVVTIATTDGLHADALRSTIEAQTGLRLAL